MAAAKPSSAPPVGLLRVTLTVSAGSTVESSAMGMVNVFGPASPSRKVSVPVVAA